MAIRDDRVYKTGTKIIKGEDGYTRVIYHDTVVVAFNDNEIILNNGGYQTVTSKARMNGASNQFDLGFRVDGSTSTYKREALGPWKVTFKGKTVEFANNMKLVRKVKRNRNPKPTLADKSEVKMREWVSPRWTEG